MMSAAAASRKQSRVSLRGGHGCPRSARPATPARLPRRGPRIDAGAPMHPACCDRCRQKRNTLFDLPEGLICLVCAFAVGYDQLKRSDVILLIKASVGGRGEAGVINIERRRRAIAKRQSGNHATFVEQARRAD